MPKLEDILKMFEKLEVLPYKVAQLTEVVEDCTNRQLRETLVFKNIPEEGSDESYKQTKELLATVISTHCSEISYEVAFSQIKRAHRERKRSEGQDFPEGKRLIYAAFHGCDICQTIIVFSSKKY